jgi:hypothetical protein
MPSKRRAEMGKLKFRESVTRSKIFSDLKEIYDKYFVVKVMMESSSVEKDKDDRPMYRAFVGLYEQYQFDKYPDFIRNVKYFLGTYDTKSKYEVFIGTRSETYTLVNDIRLTLVDHGYISLGGTDISSDAHKHMDGFVAMTAETMFKFFSFDVVTDGLAMKEITNLKLLFTQGMNRHAILPANYSRNLYFSGVKPFKRKTGNPFLIDKRETHSAITNCFIRESTSRDDWESEYNTGFFDFIEGYLEKENMFMTRLSTSGMWEM